MTRLPTESCALDLCLGQTLREDVYAERDNPPFDRVCMDGIAIDSASFSAGMREFRIQGTQPAGAPALALATPSDAIEVATGAVLPAGADAVIPLEDYEWLGDVAEIRGNALGKPYRNVARRGSDSRRDYRCSRQEFGSALRRSRSRRRPGASESAWPDRRASR